MSSEKSLIKKLKKIEDNRFEDHASKLLFYYCKGVNSFHHRLGKGLDIPLAQKGKSGDLIMTHDTDMCVYIDNAFLKVDRESDLALPKKEQLHRLSISSYNYFLEKHFYPNDFEINENYVEDEIYHYSVEDDDFTRILASLSPDLGEERCETVVVIHGPAIKRMVVALRALDPHPHEHLGHVFGDLQRIGLVLIVVGGGTFEGAAAGAKQLAHHLVHRYIVSDLVLQPVVVEQHRLVAHLVG